MQANTLEAPAKERFTVVAEGDLLEHIRRRQQRVEQQTGVRLNLSQAAAGLLRRGLQAVSHS